MGVGSVCCTALEKSLSPVLNSTRDQLMFVNRFRKLVVVGEFEVAIKNAALSLSQSLGRLNYSTMVQLGKTKNCLHSSTTMAEIPKAEKPVNKAKAFAYKRQLFLVFLY